MKLGAFTRVKSTSNDSIESLFYIPSGECYNAGEEFIQNVISILLRSSTTLEFANTELDKVFYQKCPGVGSLDEEQTSQDARSSLAELSELSSTRTSSSADIEINTDTVPVTTNRINDQRINLTITNNILFINNVTKVFSSTILITTPTLETKSSRYSNIKYNACNSHKTSH